MSTKPMRHFQHRDGDVQSTREFASSFEDDGAFTEVKVVPLDAVVIDGPLPEVKWRPMMQRWETTPDERGVWAERDGDPSYYEARAQEYVAMARHLREHPTVDEVEVERLADLLRETDTCASWKASAQALVQRGVRVEVAR